MLRTPWLLAWLLAGVVGAGDLSGPIFDAGVSADLVDLVQLPASAGVPPLARVNFVREAPDGTGRLFINDMRGPLHVFDGTSLSLYMNLSVPIPSLRTNDLQLGFVSFAFHPDFALNGHFYTAHTEYVGALPPNLTPALPITVVHHAVLTEWTATDPLANSFAGTSRQLMRIASPHSYHNLGAIGFDPHQTPASSNFGLLYISCGDFGSVARGDVGQLQRLDTVYGCILRIDPLGASFLRNGITYPYGLPANNPFVADGDPSTWGEIFAYGFRNPENFHFDSAGSGRFLVAEIGESHFEEVDLPTPGANCGWPLREGTMALDPLSDPSAVFALPGDDSTLGFIYPAAQYDHQEGRAIAGGFAVQGLANNLAGQFVFGDIVNGRLFYADLDAMLAADDGNPATTANVYQLHLLRDGIEKTLLDVLRIELGTANVFRTDVRFSTDLGARLFVTTKQDGYVRELIPLPLDPTAVELGLELGQILTGLPNPFRPGSEISFRLAGAVDVQFELFDLAGRRVRTLVDCPLPAGVQSVRWDGRDDRGAPMASGVYLGRIRAGSETQRCKFVLQR